MQSFPVPIEGEDDSKPPAPVPYDDKVVARLQQLAGQHGLSVDQSLAGLVVTQARGITVPVTRPGLTLEAYLGAARRVENAVPKGSNWDGRDEPAPAAGKGSPQ